MFDGYDEYSEGCNESIDKILKNGKDNCTIIVSSRSGEFLYPIKTSMDEEVRITGFSEENIIKCAEKYLGPEKSCDFLSQAEQAGIYEKYRSRGLLHIPIILLMSCAVFIENKCLPSRKTQIFEQVVKMCISRTTLKTMGKTANEVENLHELMLKLGKLAWEALKRKRKQLLLAKVRRTIKGLNTIYSAFHLCRKFQVFSGNVICSLYTFNIWEDAYISLSCHLGIIYL